MIKIAFITAVAATAGLVYLYLKSSPEDEPFNDYAEYNSKNKRP